MTSAFPFALDGFAFVVAAVALGFLFGFFIERGGFSSSRVLAGQFYFREWRVLKVMFTAIVVAMLGIVFFSMTGWLDAGAIYVPEGYVWPQIAGGLLLGAGFILGGFCPGTAVAAAAIGKLDGLAFAGGIVFGIFAYGMAEPSFSGFANSGSLGPLTLYQWLGTSPALVAFGVAAIAIAAFWVAEKSEGDWKLFEKTYGADKQEGNE
ncbi:MAG TPA: YeeE/YedE thiosulfate transporter family protein [Bryobacteraceae bacterium]|nr:YeeE/YedE thiosulfate transporter family protein [Bryobacteraceae bacterium]